MQVFNSQKVLAVGQTSGSGGWVKKISLDIDQWQWDVDCVRQPKKTMSNSISLFEGVSSNWIFKMVFPRRRKELFLAMNVWLSRDQNFWSVSVFQID
jgi:hypothetical protein